VKFNNDQQTSFMAVNKASLLRRFLTSQRERYTTFYDLNEQQLDLIIENLTRRLSSSTSPVKLSIIKRESSGTKILVA